MQQEQSRGIRVIDAEFDVVGVVASMNLGEKLSRCLFRDGRIAAQMEFFVDIRLCSAVQPNPLIGTTNHRFVSRELIPRPVEIGWRSALRTQS